MKNKKIFQRAKLLGIKIRARDSKAVLFILADSLMELSDAGKKKHEK